MGMSSSQYEKAQASNDPKVRELLWARAEQTRLYVAQSAMDREIQKRNSWQRDQRIDTTTRLYTILNSIWTGLQRENQTTSCKKLDWEILIAGVDLQRIATEDHGDQVVFVKWILKYMESHYVTLSLYLYLIEVWGCGLKDKYVVSISLVSQRPFRFRYTRNEGSKCL